MRKTAVVVGVSAAGLLMALPGTASAAQPPVAPPPSTQDLVQATVAMSEMQSVPALLIGPAAKATFTTGFTNPPGGQDPLPVCVYGAPYRTVDIPPYLPVGYSARNGNVTQNEFVYPTPEIGARAWALLSSNISSRCTGSWTTEEGTSTVTAKRLAAKGAAGPGWSVTTKTPYNVLQVVVAPVDGGIQQVVYSRQNPTVPSGVVAAVEALSYRLADSWAKRADLPVPQGSVSVQAAQSMLRPSDVPAELPVTSPQDGGWSTLVSDAPGNGPLGCRSNGTAGSWTSTSSLGGWGDVTAEPGSLAQNVEAYQSDDASAEAWRKLRRLVLACNDPTPPALSQTKFVSRVSSGESAFVYDGVPALWLRQFTSDPQSGFSVKGYTVYVLVENNIQSVSYYLTRDGLNQIPLDQLAVNQLARTLADRYVAEEAS